ncbi:TetR/AcrR family transcriptional regulator [Nonomuraea sp. NPDC048892]|uniref:TetR/AcrR family transcriptional regulator n=1 Tax=Nonomuraea sp. NPDC048892 TaxID=3154624 RepID=UPI0033F9FDB7
MDSPPEGGERQLILRVATKLFSALGYDSTSLEQIADAAGVDIPAINAHVTTKRQLYLDVMEQIRELVASALQPYTDELAATPPEGRGPALHRFLDAYIDMCVAHPEVPALWMHRWLSDASDIFEVEARDAQPLTRYLVASITRLTEPVQADPLHLTYTMIWCVHGFVLSGVLEGQGLRSGVDDSGQLRRFRAHMHQLFGRVLWLPPLSGPVPGGV